MSSLNKLYSWKDIGNHSNKITEKSLNEIFMEDKDRFMEKKLEKHFPYLNNHQIRFLALVLII